MGPPCLHSALQHGVVNVSFCHGTLQSIFPKQIVHTCNLSSQCHLVWPQCPAGKIHYLLTPPPPNPTPATGSGRHPLSSWLIIHGHQNLIETQHWGDLATFLFFFKEFFFFNTYLAAPSLSCHMRDLRCRMRHLVPLPGIKPRPPALGEQSLNHWTTRKSFAAFLLLSKCLFVLLQSFGL